MTAIPTPSGALLNRAAANDIYDITKQSCATCRFWQPDQDAKADSNERSVTPTDNNVGFGFCRRNPPRLVDRLVELNVEPPRYGNQIDADEGFNATATFDSTSFPGTFFSEWCGQHEWLPELEPVRV